MSKIQINEEEYVSLVNEEMTKHSEYKEGMGIELTPESTIKPLGLHIIGGTNANGIVSWAEAKIREEYDVVISR